jgi:UDP-glucose 4-epimerase
MTVAIAVTGASGSIGRAVLAQIARLGHRAVTVEPDAMRREDIATIAAQLIGSSPQAIIHLAGVTPASADLQSQQPFAANVSMTAAIVRASAEVRHPPRIVLGSSAAVYGASTLGSIPEDHPLAGGSSYALSKLAAENLVLRSGFDACVIRIFNVFGPRQHSSLVNRLRQSTSDAPVELLNPEQFIRDYVHVDDVASAIVRACLVEDLLGVAAINVGSGQALCSRQLVDRLRAVGFGAHHRAITGPPSRSVADVGLAQSVLGWHSAVTVEDNCLDDVEAKPPE